MLYFLGTWKNCTSLSLLKLGMVMWLASANEIWAEGYVSLWSSEICDKWVAMFISHCCHSHGSTCQGRLSASLDLWKISRNRMPAPPQGQHASYMKHEREINSCYIKPLRFGALWLQHNLPHPLPPTRGIIKYGLFTEILWGHLFSKIYPAYNSVMGLPRWLSGKEYACQWRRCRFNP